MQLLRFNHLLFANEVKFRQDKLDMNLSENTDFSQETVNINIVLKYTLSFNV